MAEDRTRSRPVVFDDDNPEWTAGDFARARADAHLLPAGMAEGLVRKRGRPTKAAGEAKVSVSMRLAPDLLTALRAVGRGWQTKAEALLRSGMGLGEPVKTKIARDGRTGQVRLVRKAASKRPRKKA